MKTTFTLVFDGKKYQISPYSAWAEGQMIGKYGEKITNMFLAENNELILSEVVYLLADEALKTDYPTLETFQKCIVTPDEKQAVVTMAFKTIFPAIRTEKTAEELEEEGFIKKKLQKKSPLRNIWSTLALRLTRPLAGLMNIFGRLRGQKSTAK